MASRPENVGILAADVYFPTSCVRQAELEVFDGVSQGKYTIGLGQDTLGFCTDLEDVVSLSLTVVQSLLEKYKIAPERIGRLEVGSETVIDKSKSIKTCLMQLFEVSILVNAEGKFSEATTHVDALVLSNQESGNGDVEGVDSTNACYGGTAALQNSLNWVESSAWDGRLALVVAADVAVYAEGAARPTGGAGAVALLIGPNAPLVFERKYTATHMAHVYDFYKPDLPSEYPVVDGKLSQTCYLRALDFCYRRFSTKFEKHEGKPFTLGDADYVVVHAPYNKLVQKSYARLVYNDFLKSASHVDDIVAEKLKPYAEVSHEDSLANRDLERDAWQAAKAGYNVKVAPGTRLPKEIGNMYCASLYAGLACLLYNKSDSLEGKRVLLFSYGSGLAATLFSLRVKGGQKPFDVPHIASVLDIDQKLSSRIVVAPDEFVKTMHLMETRYGAKDYVPASYRDRLRPGTYYLTGVDAKFRRTYARVPLEKEIEANGVDH